MFKRFIKIPPIKRLSRRAWLPALAALITGISLASGLLQPAFAQSGDEPTGFKNVTLWVNPEYDDPRLLVMLEGKITGISAPVPVRFMVPATAVMNSAGSKDARGNYTGGPPDRKASPIAGWDEISYILKTDTFRVEYYDSGISGNPDKKIAYDFLRLYPISDLKVIIQEPRGSSGFTVSPEGAKSTDAEFYNVHNYSYNNLGVDTPLHFDIAYTRSATSPSAGNSFPAPAGPATTGADLSTDLTTVIFVMAVLGGGTVLWINKSRKKPKYARPHAGGKRKHR